MVRFDAFDLIARRGHLEGVVDPFALSRLAEELDERLGDSEPAAGVRWRIDGTADALGHPALDVALDGALPVTCQRCLGALAFRVTQRTRLLVAKSEAELAALDDSGEDEVVLGASPLDALQLVEDELLLSLPHAPRHEEGECPVPAKQDADAAEAAPPSPFATLAGLKPARGRNRSR